MKRDGLDSFGPFQLQFNDPISLHEQISLLTLGQDMAQLPKNPKIFGFYYALLNVIVSMYCR